MKKGFIIFSLLLMATIGFGQTVLNFYPKGYLLDFSVEGEKAYNEHNERCDELWAKDNKQLTPAEKEYLNTCAEVDQDYWDPVGRGCSWYCGGGPDSVSASSYLPAQGEVTYVPKNMHNLDYKSAWVEGVKGYGIGEYVTYHFNARSPRITEIKIANGYVKSQTDWENNSRVKTLKIHLNDKPYAIVHLEDCRCESSFKVEPIGNGEEKYEFPKDAPGWTLKFEIVEVYPGKKYDDTVISEIYFDGIDVH